MPTNLHDSLSKLNGNSVSISPSDDDAVKLLFSGGAKLEAQYWRVIENAKEVISSFDHQQKYGLPAPIDAIKKLETVLEKKTVTEAQLDRETGDLLFQFTGNVKLQVFAFSGYEVWEIHFPDGTGEYSNFAK